MSKADAAASLPITFAQRTEVGVRHNDAEVSIGELARYVLETLREDQEFALYRGQQPGHPSRVLILAPVGEKPAPASLKRLEHEYSFAAELDAAWAARPLALVRHEGRMMLVLEDLGGEPLDRALGRPLELTRLLSLAIGIAAALGQVHRRGLVHKDIKPANVLVDADGNVRLTGFGIASRLPRERQAPAPPEVIAGTFAYMAPEQTGRMNRSVDARSDLYSLGVTLYEMLTGKLPFDAADPLEWVHSHIARQPMPPRERVNGIPDTVAAVVLKLLAKTPEERYQTAAGVEADLIRCLAEWESLGRIDQFPLGAYDASNELIIPERLYGREREIDALMAAFERVTADGIPELVLVSGYSGIGKSSVVQELHKALVPPRGLFAAGKFDRCKRDVPYSTLAQAFRNLLCAILGQSEAELGRWRDAIQQAVGLNGQLIVDLLPELELVIGKQQPVPDVPPQDAQNRFQMVFRRFIGAFAQAEHPLALFLDDLQWVDAATLDFLTHLVTEPEVRNLLLIGAYRDNEVRQSDPLIRTLETIRKSNARVHEILLTPLSLDDIDRLVSDTLHWDHESARPLAQLVHEKTAGNPFFAIQFIAALAEENLIAFDADTASWTCDLAGIRAKGFTDNVLDLMVDKLHRLPATTQEALKQFACVGNSAETATLCMVLGASEEETHAALWEAVRAGLVFRLDGAYTFLHDRVQEAAYTLIPEGERAAFHLRIGRLLVAQIPSEKLEQRLFDIVNQFNRGVELITEQEERERVAELNLIAGNPAKAATAYASALNYFAAGKELLENREALVAAEIARLDGRDPDAMRLYEEAIRSAHENGFVQNEGLANELAARFYAARGFETIARAYLRNARYCYVRWGADGKVRDLERLHPYLREEPAPVRPTATVGTPVEDLDLATVVKVSQAVSGEIVLEKLIHRLMMIAVEHSGAERGLLILSRGDKLHIMAEATTSRDTVEVHLRQTVMIPVDLPESVLQYVIRTQESVILDDASAPNQFSTDEYIGKKHSRSILCLPLIKQTALIGVLYLENSLTPYAFTPTRLAVLRLLASQAAISLENAGLYADLQVSGDHLRLVINSIPAIVGTASPKGTIDFINERWQEYTGLTSSGGFNDAWIAVIHPDDIGGMLDAWRSAVQTGHPFEYQARMRNTNGDYRWFVYRGMPLRDEQGNIVKWYVAAHDIDAQRSAEERLRQDEQELRRLVDSVPYLVSTLDMDGHPLNVNRETLEYVGLSVEDLVKAEDPRSKVYHPEDLGAVRDTLQGAFSKGTGQEVEARMRRHDGQYRWFLIHYEPLHDENGQIIRWHVSGTDIDDRKRAEERVIEENLALREEIDKASMFEEIVGTSTVLQAVLDNVSKVARTDSTVLITGETGTGKELIARAIHKRSKRSARAFVSVNCAAIPPSLIASELFGHEKGAFTGATQRRLGRFELADGGTIFLDEIGDLPLDTQLTLLRVLQEREFERVGGTRSISVDVRVIAATNRDLEAAMADGEFRSDLFYRLNVFPIDLPPLRERRDDIPLLVEYFIDRYAIKYGKEIRSINKRSLDLLQSYSWPGNIRELQNVVERAVIICEGETFSVDESWLSRQTIQPESPSRPLFKISAAQEKETIEAALAETKGRVSGRLGAAIKLGIPASTLDSKIKALRIDKNRFKSSAKRDQKG
jgi:PAS domain S-box-containing protein